MRPRWLVISLGLLVPLAAAALFQGMITAGLAPLAVFAPIYALARSLGHGSADSRRQAAQVTVAATVGLGFALLPATGVLGGSAPLWASLGLAAVAAGAGGLAAFASAPSAHELGARERQSWAFVDAMSARHARGLAMLAGVAVPAGTLVALLREAPIVRAAGAAKALPEALLGAHAVDGALVLPDPSATVAVAIPLSLAPLALGFLTSPKRAAPLALGGLAIPLLAPVVLGLDVPVEAGTGALVPISVLDQPGLAVVEALAPASAGLLAGAALVYAGKQGRLDPIASRSFWALGAALVTIVIWGLFPSLLVLVAVWCVALALAVTGQRAPFGLAVLLGSLVGVLVEVAIGVPSGLAAGTLIGVAVGSAAGVYGASRSIELPGEGLGSPWMLVYLLGGVLSAGLLYAVVGDALTAGATPFPLPHARALSAGLQSLIEGRGLLLVAWGLIAGGIVEALIGAGAWVAVGALAGPGVAGLVLVGSLLRVGWEQGLLERAREGYVMRGQLGYELLRAHVLVAGVLVGEALAMGIAALVG